MLIELHRKVVGDDYERTCCAICGNDFGRGSVYPVALTDDGRYEIGETCPTCLDYLNRRKEDADDPTLENWPARDWPTVEDLEDARRRHPEPMFRSRADFEAAAPDLEAQDAAFAAAVVWSQEREEGGAC